MIAKETRSLRGRSLSNTRLAVALLATTALGGTVVYGVIRVTVGMRLDQEDEYNGADLSIHKISATSE